MTETQTLAPPRTQTNDGDHDRFAHYVRKDLIPEAYIEGTPMVALCGKVWVPSRDPKKYPVCPECKEIFEAAFGKEDGDD